MSIEIDKPLLEKVCRDVIETILFCIPGAFKGTIYRVGKPPDLITERITSGVIDEARQNISWDLPAKSEYNAPGKPWIEYRDQPGRPLEAMSWCVEKQKSWTAENPKSDTRSVRLQVEGTAEDCFHMEPVLVGKSDLGLDMDYPSQYPTNYDGNIIWEDSEYVVVSVIKIHFIPFTVKIGGHETKVIKRLSRSLGTELLSYKLQQDSVRTMQQIAQSRLTACNVLADSLRNAITKSGLIFSLVKQEIGYLRDQWEQMLLENRSEQHMKAESIRILNELLLDIDKEKENEKEVEELRNAHQKFLKLSFPPQKAENWIAMQIERRWRALLHKLPQNDQKSHMIWCTIATLKKSLHLGHDPRITACCNLIPEDLKQEWVSLIYTDDDRYDASVLERLIILLDNPALGIASRERSRKTLSQLKALADTINQLEQNTDFLLSEVLNGATGIIPDEILDPKRLSSLKIPLPQPAVRSRRFRL